MNLPPELQERFDKIILEREVGTKRVFVKTVKMDAYNVARGMIDIMNELPEASRTKFAKDTVLPFLIRETKACEIAGFDSKVLLIDIQNSLQYESYELFLNELLGIYSIDLNTKAWTRLTESWNPLGSAQVKMSIYIKGLGDQSKPFVSCGYDTVDIDDLRNFLGNKDIKGRARSPFLRAVEAVKIEQEHPGFFAGFNRMCRSLKTPEVG